MDNLLKKACKAFALGLFITFSSFSHAANIAYISDFLGDDTVAFLDPPHNVTEISMTDIDSGALAKNFDALIIAHTSTGWSATTCSQLQTFLNNGKGIVLEGNAATAFFTQDSNINYQTNYSCTFFSGTIAGGFSSNIGSDISIADASSPLATGLSNPFSMDDGGEVNDEIYQISGYDTTIWDVAGTYTDSGNGSDYPAMMSASYQNNGCVTLTPFDALHAYNYGGTAQANYEQLMTNLVNVALNPAQCRASAPVNAANPNAIPSTTLTALISLSTLLGLFAIARRRFS